MGLIERLRQGLQPHLKVLLSDVLNELEPVKVIKKPKPDYREALLKMYDQDERFKTPLPEYDLPIQQPVKDKPSDPKLFPQSDVQNNKGPNSAKGTNREEVIAS